MSLRTKTLLIVTITFVCVFAIVATLLGSMMNNIFAGEEERTVRDKVQQVTSAVMNELADLEGITTQWAIADDSYDFMATTGAEYIETHLNDANFANNRIELALFVNLEGKIVFSKAFSLADRKELPFPISIKEHLLPGSRLLRQVVGPSGPERGLINLADGPMFVVSSPVLMSNGSGLARGNLILGRYVNAAEIEHLSVLTRSSIVAFTPSSPDLPSDFRTALLSVVPYDRIWIRPLSNESIGGYTAINDIYDKPALVMRVDMPRTIYMQGRSLMLFFGLALLDAGQALEAVR